LELSEGAVKLGRPSEFDFKTVEGMEMVGGAAGAAPITPGAGVAAAAQAEKVKTNKESKQNRVANFFIISSGPILNILTLNIRRNPH